MNLSVQILQFLLRYIMQSGAIRRGLHIDDDEDEVRKPDEYGGIDANRKRGNFEKNLDDMLFGGGPPPPRRRPAPPAENKQKSQDTSKKQPPKPAVNQSTDAVNKSNALNTSGKTTQQPIQPTPSPAKKQTSILKPSGPADKSTGGTLPIISKPDVVKAPENVQPQQQTEDVAIQSLHGFSNKNKFNKPGYLRKGKKVAQNFKFAEENVTLHSSVDVVRPYETDRGHQRKLNDFDFHDFQFPATGSVLGSASKDKASSWKKPNELARTVNFGKYVDPNDFNPGALSSPQFLSVLSGIAELEANTKRLIEDQQTNSNGFYLVRLFVNSVWRYIAVDSSLPFIDGQNAGVASYADHEFDLQGALIEKAYAKSFGSYDVFARTQPREYYLRDLTGAPVKKYSIDSSELQNAVKKALGSGQVVQAVPTERIAALGVNPNFSYSVINFTGKGLELRNSWGTLEERPKTNFRAEGTFQLSSVQLRDNFSHVLVSCLNTEYATSTVQSRHRSGFYSTYTFKVRSATHGFLTVSQWDERLFPSTLNYEYSPATIILQKDTPQGPQYINANHSINSRNLDLEVNLEAGSYTVFVAISFKKEEHSFNLTSYASEKVDFCRVYTDKEPGLIGNALEQANVEHAKRNQISKTTAQYISYHRESNCILITVENTSPREGRSGIDLSRAKLDKVSVLSGHNNEDNYSDKVAYEIDEYKQAALSDRRWTVQLESGQRFTWVLAAHEAYNEGNLRGWGFN